MSLHARDYRILSSQYRGLLHRHRIRNHTAMFGMNQTYLEPLEPRVLLSASIQSPLLLDNSETNHVAAIEPLVNSSPAAQVPMTATYRLDVNNTWSEQTNPGSFPQDAHFSWFGGATHNDQVNFWNVGQVASAGIKEMAETGATFILEDEVEAAIIEGATDSLLSYRHWFCPLDIPHPNCGTMSVEFDINMDYPLVTLVSMLGPSPDWFVGVSGLSMMENGHWIPELTIDLRPLDGGTRSENRFELFGTLTDPPDPVSVITTESGQLIGPGSLGTLTFTRIAPAGITVTPNLGLVTTEAGESASFDVVLDSQPTEDVTIKISSDDTTEGMVSAAAVTFTTDNWSVPQTVTVTGLDDGADDGNINYTVVLAPAMSEDVHYSGLDGGDVSVSNTDNDPTTNGPAEVVARHIFYNNSVFDAVSDDDAIASGLQQPTELSHGKTPLLPGETASFANYTSFTKGINGIMVDIVDRPQIELSADDFGFRVGNDNLPFQWVDATAPLSMTVGAGAGVGASDRVTIIWPDNAIRNQWLQVTVKATDHTGLADDDVFYFGNAIGETGDSEDSTKVDVFDVVGVRMNTTPFNMRTTIENRFDFNRDQRVDLIDLITARNNSTTNVTALSLISVVDSDPPNAVDDGPFGTDEGVPVEIPVSTLLGNDTDMNGDGTIDASTFEIIATPSNGTAIELDGTVTYTPNGDFFGQDTFRYTVRDTTNVISNEGTITVKVTAVNDSPTLEAIADPVAIAEDAGLQTVTLMGISSGGGESQALTVTATSDNPLLIPNGNIAVNYTSPDTTGSIDYTPVSDAFGTATITVTVIDDGGTANAGDINTMTRTFTVAVNAVNDSPTLEAIADPVAIAEDAGLQTVTLMGISSGGGESQALTVTATSDNPLLIPNGNIAVNYTSPDTTGSIDYTPVSDAFGTATITVTVIDDGGTANAGDINTMTRTFTVAVNAVNDSPTLEAIADPVAIAEDAGLQTVTLMGISSGGGESQALTVTATSDNPLLIPNGNIAVNYTSPDTTGSIDYTPVSDAFGTATITVTVIDDGGTANAGDINTMTRTFTVAVNAVNDSPTLEVIADPVAIAEGAGLQTVTLTGISSGGGESQALTVTATSDNPLLLPNGNIAVNYTSPDTTGTIDYTPVSDAFGTATITVTVIDDGGTANAGDINTMTRTFTVAVNAVNDSPTLEAIADPVAIAEDAGLQTVTLMGISSGGGESQALTVTATSDNPLLIPNGNIAVNYTSPDTTGSIDYTPVSDAFGTATITVTVSDDGGAGNGGDNSVQQTFTVTVNSVNDLPTINAIATRTVIPFVNGEQQVIEVDFSGATAGAVNEAQTLSISASSDNEAAIGSNPLQVIYTSPNAAGTVRFIPVDRDTLAVAQITVTIDDGQDSVDMTFDVIVGPSSPYVITAVKDNTIYRENGERSLGAGTKFFVGTTKGTKSRRALVQFEPLDPITPDLAVPGIHQLPGDATITSANLNLNLTKSPSASGTLLLHQLSASWGEAGSSVSGKRQKNGADAEPGDATYTHRFFDSTAWTTAGGDFNATPTATVNAGTTQGLVTFSSTQAMIDEVQGWRDNFNTNFGWLLKLSASDEARNNSIREFNSREGKVPPTLVISYTIPDPNAVNAAPTAIDDSVDAMFDNTVSDVNLPTGIVSAAPSPGFDGENRMAPLLSSGQRWLLDGTQQHGLMRTKAVRLSNFSGFRMRLIDPLEDQSQNPDLTQILKRIASARHLRLGDVED